MAQRQEVFCAPLHIVLRSGIYTFLYQYGRKNENSKKAQHTKPELTDRHDDKEIKHNLLIFLLNTVNLFAVVMAVCIVTCNLLGTMDSFIYHLWKLSGGGGDILYPPENVA